MSALRIRKWFSLIIWLPLGLASSGSLGQEIDAAKERLEKSPRHHEWIDVKTKTGRNIRAFLVYPETNKPVPGVLVIHENRGLTDWVRSVADQLAEAGYVALAPDLLSGRGPGQGGTASFPSSDAAREAIYQLSPQQVLDDLDACTEYLRRLEVTNRTLAVAGFCWGGSQTFQYATHNPDTQSAFVFYGSAPTDLEQLKRIKAPVYGFYGGDDFRVTGKVPQTTEMMKKLKKQYAPTIYDGAGHAFMRTGEDPAGKPANQKARQEAWGRWKDLLRRLDESPTTTRSAAASAGTGDQSE